MGRAERQREEERFTEDMLAHLLTESAISFLVSRGNMPTAIFADYLGKLIFREAINRALRGQARLGLLPTRRATRRIAAQWLIDRLDQTLDAMFATEDEPLGIVDREAA